MGKIIIIGYTDFYGSGICNYEVEKDGVVGYTNFNGDVFATIPLYEVEGRPELGIFETQEAAEKAQHSPLVCGK